MSDRYLHIDAGRVIFDTTRMLADYPDLADDEQLRADVLEGETDIASVMTRLFLGMRADEAQAEGAKALKSDLDVRQKRFEDRAKNKKALALSIMEAADLSKLELPAATFSVRDPQPLVAIDDVNELPQGFRRVKVEAAKTEIKKALMAGEDVPGARLELGQPSLAIRGA